MSNSKQGMGKRPLQWDDPLVILTIVAVFYLGGWALWAAASAPIARAYAYVRYAEFWVLEAIGLRVPIVEKICQPTRAFDCARDFATVEWTEITSSSVMLNGFWLVILVGMCVWMYRRVNATHPQLKFIKKHTIQSFVAESRQLYPHLRVFGALDLLHQPLDHPVFGMSMTSRQFAYHHRLIAGWKEMSDGSVTPTLDRERTAQLFRRQLGRHWTKSTELSAGETMLAAIAIPRVAATDPSLSDEKFKEAMKDSEDAIRWCWSQFKPDSSSLEWLTPAIDLAYPRQLILKHIGHPAVRSVIERHAFARTVLFGLFIEARRLGVLAPAEMRWLRFFDRELWYVLQSIGRQAPFGEGGIAHSHYLYERKAGAALPEPQVDKAINALESAMSAFKFTTDDRERYENSSLPETTF